MSESFEVPSPHEHHVEHAHRSGDRFAGKIAVMTAIMATVGAMLSYQAGSTESEAAMDKNNAAIKKTEASNQWNYYQAKSSRENLADLASHIPGLDAAHYTAEVQRYKADKEAARVKAEALEAQAQEWDEKSERVLHSHHRWAQAMMAIQMAISLAAITLLTRKEWLQKVAYGAGGVSVVLGGDGLVAPLIVMVPTLCVGMPGMTLCVKVDAERQSMRYHAERGNDQTKAHQRQKQNYQAYSIPVGAWLVPRPAGNRQ